MGTQRQDNTVRPTVYQSFLNLWSHCCTIYVGLGRSTNPPPLILMNPFCFCLLRKFHLKWGSLVNWSRLSFVRDQVEKRRYYCLSQKLYRSLSKFCQLLLLLVRLLMAATAHLVFRRGVVRPNILWPKKRRFQHLPDGNDNPRYKLLLCLHSSIFVKK